MQAGYLVLLHKLRRPHMGSCSFEPNCSQVSNEGMRYGGSYNNLIISGTPSVMVLGQTHHHRIHRVTVTLPYTAPNLYPAKVIRSSHEAAAQALNVSLFNA